MTAVGLCHVHKISLPHTTNKTKRNNVIVQKSAETSLKLPQSFLILIPQESVILIAFCLNILNHLKEDLISYFC